MEENFKLTEYIEDIKSSLDYFQKEYYRSVDPVSFLISEEGAWLLNNKLKNSSSVLKKDLITSILKDINTIISKRSKGLYHIRNINAENGKIELFIGTEEKSLIYWELFSLSIKVKDFDRVTQLNKEIEELENNLKTLQGELEESSIILKKKEALANNGYYVAYVKSLIRPGKFKKDSQAIINSYSVKISEIENKIKQKQNEISIISLGKDTPRLLEILELGFRRFPRIKSYSDYLTYIKEKE